MRLILPYVDRFLPGYNVTSLSELGVLLLKDTTGRSWAA